jgi:hypothetical protein
MFVVVRRSDQVDLKTRAGETALFDDELLAEMQAHELLCRPSRSTSQ